MKITKSPDNIGMYRAQETSKGVDFFGIGNSPREAQEECLKKIAWYEQDFEDDMRADGREAEEQAKEELEERDEDLDISPDGNVNR